MPATLRVMPGDIFLTRGSSLMSKAIRLCTRTIGEKRSRVNHVGFVTTDTMLRMADCIEALSTVREHSLWAQYASECARVAIYRVKNWSDEDRSRCIELAREYKGRKYGYLALAAHFLDWLLQGAYVFRRLTNSGRYPICSWLVDHVCSKLGVSFGVPAGAANPDDIWDHIQAHPGEFAEVLPLGRLSRRKRAA